MRSRPSPEPKSEDKSERKLYGAVADDALRGRGPEPGAPNAGRPPIAFRQACKDIQRDVVLPKVQQYLNEHTPKDPGWQWAARYISRYGEKETARIHEVGGPDGAPIDINIVDVRTRIGNKVSGIAQRMQQPTDAQSA